MNVLKSEILLLYEKIFANEFYLSLTCFCACKLTDTAKFEQQMYTPVVVYVYSNRTNCTHQSYKCFEIILNNFTKKALNSPKFTVQYMYINYKGVYLW